VLLLLLLLVVVVVGIVAGAVGDDGVHGGRRVV
jgi:hypothetical protein